MKINDKEIFFPKNKNIVLPLIIFSNLFPLYGVINYNWTLFSVIYIYWIELLIITFFELLKILLAQGDAQATFFNKLSLSLKFLIIRLGTFFFYLIFIVVFLGFSMNEKGGANTVLGLLTIKGSFYKITILSFVIYNLVDFIVHFILNKEYLTSIPRDNFQLFDAHIIIVHLVIVLGTFLFKGVYEYLHWEHKTAMIICVSLFVLLKIFADYFKSGRTQAVLEKEQGKFI